MCDFPGPLQGDGREGVPRPRLHREDPIRPIKRGSLRKSWEILRATGWLTGANRSGTLEVFVVLLLREGVAFTVETEHGVRALHVPDWDMRRADG